MSAKKNIFAPTEIESLPWRSSFPQDIGDASKKFEGGFLSLEEIDDEPLYGLQIENQMEQNSDKGCGNEILDDDKVETKREAKRKKTKKTNKITAGLSMDDDTLNNVEVDESAYVAWNELRLHPIIMKSIYRLRFEYPMDIQKGCIRAAHGGKDIIGAAVTGSGKTLAFALPILQRLLDEQDKSDRLMAQGEEANIIAPRRILRVLILTPTRELAVQVERHVKDVARGTNIRVVSLLGGLSLQRQERLLESRPEVVVGTPGRIWEIMSSGTTHLVELDCLSFFVVDEADRMIKAGCFPQLQSIIDMLPKVPANNQLKSSEKCNSHHRKKRQTFVFSATLSLPAEVLKTRGKLVSADNNGRNNSMMTIFERLTMSPDTAIVNLTGPSGFFPSRLVQSVIECSESEKDAYLYYILTIHGKGRILVFCSSIDAVRHVASYSCLLNRKVMVLHSQMKQNGRFKSFDRFDSPEDCILVASDAAARGLNFVGVGTVVHYQLPHEPEVYIHRCGRTARASADGCSIALCSPYDASKYSAIRKLLTKVEQGGVQRFPVEMSYMPDIMKRLSLANLINKHAQKIRKEKGDKGWFSRHAEAVGVDWEVDDYSEEAMARKHKQDKASSQLSRLQQELQTLLSRPLMPKSLSKSYFAGAGLSPLFQNQLEVLAKRKLESGSENGRKRQKLLALGQECVEPLDVLKNVSKTLDSSINSSKEPVVNVEKTVQNQKSEDKSGRKETKRRLHAGTACLQKCKSKRAYAATFSLQSQ